MTFLAEQLYILTRHCPAAIVTGSEVSRATVITAMTATRNQRKASQGTRHGRTLPIRVYKSVINHPRLD